MDINQIHQYEITGKIGESVSSIIYKAFDPESQSEVVLKQLKPNDSVKRDLHKIKSYIGIEHQNLSKILAVDEFDNRIVIVSEYFDGLPLQQLLNRSQFESKYLIDFLQQVCDALKEIHKHNLPHGNLKPSNILVDEKGKVKLIDSGLSSFFDFQNSPEFKSSYDALQYITPEQIRNEPISLQSDFFSLGIIAYRIVYGRLPFDGSNEEELFQSILEHDPDFTVTETETEQSLIILLLEKLLSKDQQNRFVNTGEFKATLNEIQSFNQITHSDEDFEQEHENPRKYLVFSMLAVVIGLLWVLSALFLK